MHMRKTFDLGNDRFVNITIENMPMSESGRNNIFKNVLRAIVSDDIEKIYQLSKCLAVVHVAEFGFEKYICKIRAGVGNPNLYKNIAIPIDSF